MRLACYFILIPVFLYLFLRIIFLTSYHIGTTNNILIFWVWFVCACIPVFTVIIRWESNKKEFNFSMFAHYSLFSIVIIHAILTYYSFYIAINAGREVQPVLLSSLIWISLWGLLMNIYFHYQKKQAPASIQLLDFVELERLAEELENMVSEAQSKYPDTRKHKRAIVMKGRFVYANKVRSQGIIRQSVFQKEFEEIKQLLALMS